MNPTILIIFLIFIILITAIVIAILLIKFNKYKAHSEKLLEEANKTVTDIKKSKDASKDSLKKVPKVVFQEIREPLNGIGDFVELMSHTALDKEQQAYLENAKDALAELIATLNNIIDYLKFDEGKLKAESMSFHPRILLNDIAASFMHRVEESGLSVCVLVNSDVPESVMGDPAMLKQVIRNIMNYMLRLAVKGEVSLECRTESLDENMYKIRFAIKETTNIISDENRKSIFNILTSSDNESIGSFGQTGLGLVIASKLVKIMGGELEVNGSNNRGTEFYFVLSLSKVTCEVAENNFDFNFKGVKTIIADSNELNRSILREYLEAFEFRITEAADGKTAMEKIITSQIAGNGFELLITEQILPEMDGIQLAKSVKSVPSLNKLKLVLISSVSLKGDANQAKEAGFDAFIARPYKKHELLQMVSIAMNSPTAQSTIITKHILNEELKKDGTRILVVEDNEANKKLIIRFLQKLGHNCDVAVNGREAYEICLQKNYDVILMDCQMPEMDGYEATRAIRSNDGPNKDSTIIALTANALNGDKEKCITAGMTDFIAKPIDLDILSSMIEEYLQK